MRPVRIGWWMENTQHRIYMDWPLRMIEASKVEHSASCVVGGRWLLAAVFVSAASTPHLGAFEAGDTLS